MRRQFATICFFAVLLGCTSAFGEIETQTFQAGEWLSCGITCRYLSFPISVPPALSSGSVDSVWVTVWGTSNKGYQTFCQGSDCYTVLCWDGLLISFETTSVGESCNPLTFSPDGITDYVAGAHTPVGDNELFEATCSLSGIERTHCCEPEYRVTEPHPGFEGVFSQSQVSLRVQKVGGGPLGPHNSCSKCMDGLAVIDSVAVNIAYDGGLPVDRVNWGSFKALYR